MDTNTENNTTEVKTFLTFQEYNSFGGKLDSQKFDRFCFRAECEIKRSTFGRIKTLELVPDEVKRCEFELVEFLSKVASDGAVSDISSFSNDGYSVTYSDKKSVEAQIYDIIYTYLADTDLLYCGVG